MRYLKSFMYWSALTICGLVFFGSVVTIIEPKGAQESAATRRTNATSDADQQQLREALEDAAIERAEQRVRRYGNAEGWDRAFSKTASRSRRGYVCGTLYGQTARRYGWEFTVRYIYNPSNDRIEVQSWAMMNKDWSFKRMWSRYC
ncbi:MAG: hypothetical protein MI824_18710 [Hyphomicrobiales bacterium]|nr:hypothetical protein [Hyphomicrobiales bacterium]